MSNTSVEYPWCGTCLPLFFYQTCSALPQMAPPSVLPPLIRSCAHTHTTHVRAHYFRMLLIWALSTLDVSQYCEAHMEQVSMCMSTGCIIQKGSWLLCYPVVGVQLSRRQCEELTPEYQGQRSSRTAAAVTWLQEVIGPVWSLLPAGSWHICWDGEGRGIPPKNPPIASSLPCCPHGCGACSETKQPGPGDCCTSQSGTPLRLGRRPNNWAGQLLK